MSTLDGNNLFGSGPHEIRPESWQRAVMRRAFAGLDGELALDLGLRSRRIVQTGRLQATGSDVLNLLLAQIEGLLDGQLHTLVDSYGRVYARVLVEEFAPASAIRRGRGFWCDYRIVYRQLP
ncbi:MAG TPA: hypothetical protein DCX07_14175 [Phycisphaerales bacterium]|nr:hypothetical protein [Phycisphaerales bacterium]